MKNLIVMKRNHFATDIGMRYGFALIVALFLAPFWTWGQTSTQNGRKQGRGLFGLLMMVVFALRARKMQDVCRKSARSVAEESKHWMGWQAVRMAAGLGMMMVWMMPAMAQSVPDGIY